MATSEFAEIGRFTNAIEAEQVRGVLEANGIAAFVDGANATTALSYVGTALGGVKVLVGAGDADRAVGIVDSLDDEPDVPGKPWFCGPCEEEVDAGFDACWSCGKARAEVERPFPTRSGDERNAADQPAKDAPNVSPAEMSDYDHANPYASPRTPSDEADPVEEHFEINDEAEAILRRAWRASVLGVIFFPYLAHAYSMYLLFRATTLTSHFSPDGQRRFYGAFAINVLTTFVAVALFLLMFLMFR